MARLPSPPSLSSASWPHAGNHVEPAEGIRQRAHSHARDSAFTLKSWYCCAAGHDIDNTDELTSVGLGFTCDFDKPDGFIGREAVLEQKRRMKERGGLSSRLVQVLCMDPEPMMYHGEVRQPPCLGARALLRTARGMGTARGSLGSLSMPRATGLKL